MMRRLILVGTAVFVFGLVVMFPARVAYDAFAPPALRLSGVTGTVWDGTAVSGAAGGIYLDNLRWSFVLTSLLRGRLGFDVTVAPAGGFLDGRIEIGPGGTLVFSGLDASLSIAALQGLIPAPGIEGNVRLQFDALRVENGLPVAADGTIDVAGLLVRGLSPAPLGDFRAQIASSDRAISGSVEDINAVLDIAGSLRIGADRTYVLEGLVAPTPQTPAAVVEQLRFLGSANARGQRQFRFEGRL